MNEMKLHPIGSIENENGTAEIVLLPQYKPGLKGLSAYSHLPLRHPPHRPPLPLERFAK